ncbi:MAG: hypothetical protein ACRC28_00930 [Clostridium sp.]|uniref:hypothetical protein n=1 Tax=Clostridia TaxID=186801 RepID=UPI003F33699F
MKKKELIQAMREGFGITKVEAKRRLGYIDDLFLLVAEGEVGTKVKLGKYINVEKIHSEDRTMCVAGEERFIEGRDKLVVRATAKCKEI